MDHSRFTSDYYNPQNVANNPHQLEYTRSDVLDSKPGPAPTQINTTQAH